MGGAQLSIGQSAPEHGLRPYLNAAYGLWGGLGGILALRITPEGCCSRRGGR